jgi:hypothetical protein
VENRIDPFRGQRERNEALEQKNGRTLLGVKNYREIPENRKSSRFISYCVYDSLVSMRISEKRPYKGILFRTYQTSCMHAL